MIIGAWVWLFSLTFPPVQNRLNPLIIGAWVWLLDGQPIVVVASLNPLIIGAWVWPFNFKHGMHGLVLIP